MRNVSPGLGRTGRWLLSLALAAGLWSGSGAAARPAAAAVLGGTFVVNTNTDIYVMDSLLTLREALEAANGDYVGPFSANEQFQLFGCTFSGGFITGGCGPGLADVISFESGVGLTLTIGSALPLVDDTYPTTIDAAFNGPFTLDAANAGVNQNGLNLVSSNNTVAGLTIINSPQDGFFILGDFNVLAAGAGARASGRHGVTIVGNFNIIEDSFWGSAGATPCATGNVQNGIRIQAPAHDNVVRDNLISCNGSDGVYLTGAGTNNNQVIRNQIGTDPTGQLDRGNAGNGVVITGTASSNLVGDTLSERNVIAGNGLAGVLIGGGAFSNTVMANVIGANISGTAALANAVGVVINSGAYQNAVGLDDDTLAHLNVIGGNSGAGVQISGGGTYSNSLAYNNIGHGETNVELPNGGNGVELLAGTNRNMIGPQNHMFYSGGSGVLVAGGSITNTISGNVIDRNLAYGILLDAASHTLISPSAIQFNGLDGIGERNGATANTWTELLLYDNGGLGIDKLAASDQTNTISGPVPVITSTEIAGSTLTVRGTVPTTPGPADVVELYFVTPDPSGYGEGISLGVTTTVALNGTWMIQLPVSNVGACGLSAVYTYDVSPTDRQSSEFALNAGLCRVYLPLAVK